MIDSVLVRVVFLPRLYYIIPAEYIPYDTKHFLSKYSFLRTPSNEDYLVGYPPMS